MRSQLSFAVALVGLACSQIAGFEALGGLEGGQAGENTNGAVDATAGNDSAAGGTGAGGRSEGTSGSSNQAGETSGGPDTGDGGTSTTAGGAPGSAGGSNGGGGSGGGSGSGGGGRPGCNQQLLANADFEAGPTGWQEDSSWIGISDLSDIIVERTRPSLVTEGVQPKAGDYLAWLGGVPDTQQHNRVNVFQEVTIPAEASRIILSGWLYMKTLETDPKRFDQLDIALTEGDWFRSFRVWDNRGTRGTWESFEIAWTDGLEALRGKQLALTAESDTDPSNVTSFWLDSLSLIAECGH